MRFLHAAPVINLLYDLLNERIREYKYRERCMDIDPETYLQELEKRLEDPGFQVFHDVIRYMLKEHIRLEQKQLITVPACPHR